MRLIYRCLHCDKMDNTTRAPFNNALRLLETAYDFGDGRGAFMGVPAFRPHSCGPGITGVAQLAAVSDE